MTTNTDFASSPTQLTFKTVCILLFAAKVLAVVSKQDHNDEDIFTADDIQSIKDDLLMDQLTFDDSDYETELEKLQETCGNVLDGREFIEILMSKVTSAMKNGKDYITIPKYSDVEERKLSIEETYVNLLQLVNDILDQAEESASSINAAINFIRPQIDNEAFTLKTEVQNKILSRLKVL